jgi:hypothetical protein
MKRPADDLEVEIEILSGSSSRSSDRPLLPPPPVEDTALDLPISIVEDLPLGEDLQVPHPTRLPRARRASLASHDPVRASLSRRDALAILLALVAIAEGVALMLLSR